MKQIHTQKAVPAPPRIAPSATATILDARNLHRLGYLDDCHSLSVGAPSSSLTECEEGSINTSILFRGALLRFHVKLGEYISYKPEGNPIGPIHHTETCTSIYPMSFFD